MNISLTAEQEKFIQSQLESGNYSSAEQVIAQALQLLEERQQEETERQLAELRQKIASGTEQIARGQVTDGEIVFTILRDKICSSFLDSAWERQ